MEVVQPCVEDFIKTDHIQRYTEQCSSHNVVVIKDFMSSGYVTENYLPEVEACAKYIHRVKVGSFKKSGSVSRNLIEQHAPNLFALYHSAAFKTFIETIVGEPLYLCPASDPHAIALYNYTEPGDHIGVHYDKSFYKGRRYTVLLGMIQDSVESKLVCYLGGTKMNRRKDPLEVYTHPGTLVVFNGDKLWHEVTPLGKNERRVILTMEYLSDPRISTINRIVSVLKDRYLYFGKEK